MSNIVSDPKPYSITLKNVGGEFTADQMKELAHRLAVEFPQYAVSIESSPGEAAQSALRDSTREYLPEMASALDSGDVRGAAEVFLTDLEQRMAVRP